MTSSPAPRWAANAVAGAVLVVLAVGVLLWQRPWHHDAPAASVPTVADPSGTFGAQVFALESATTLDAFEDAAGHTAWARRTWANLRALGVTGLQLRYVSGADAPARSDGTRLVDVQVGWTPGSRSGLLTEPTATTDVTLEIRPRSRTAFDVIGSRQAHGVVPLWLVGTVAVADESGTTVLTIDGGNPEQPISQMTRTAARAVERIVPSAHGRLVVVSPATQAQTAELLGDSSADVAQVAGVTTTIDGTSRAAVARAIVLNPQEFDTMDRRASQVVMTHEATHLLTDATTSDAATWIVEGFADWVALHDDTASLKVSAGQVLAQVKADGAPKTLPTAQQFGTEQHGLGATYEAAWMAFRMLGQQHGDAAVLRFYRDALAGRTAAASAQDAFGESIAQITADWQHYLTKRASTVS